MAEGFAHWVNGKWVIVYGPWSVSCGPLKSLSKIPKAIRNSFIAICNLKDKEISADPLRRP